MYNRKTDDLFNENHLLLYNLKLMLGMREFSAKKSIKHLLHKENSGFQSLNLRPCLNWVYGIKHKIILEKPQSNFKVKTMIIASVVRTILFLVPLCQGSRLKRDTYGHPAAPVESYTAPESAPAYTAPEAGFDLTSIAVPIIALVGLFLLFPSFTTLTSVRRTLKMADRKAEEPNLNILNQIQDIYQAIVEDKSLLSFWLII